MSRARDAVPPSRATRRFAIALWLAVLVVAIVVIARARFTADLSAFLPAKPTREQALLIDQLREGPASHLILIAIEGDASPGSVPIPDAILAGLSKKTAAALRGDPRFLAHFLSVNNGETTTATRDRELLFNHRYLLSDRVAPERFTVAGLHDALNESLDLLSSSAGLMLQPLISRDPTAELVHLVDSLTAGRDLPLVDGVWIARSNADAHALLIAETRAAGSDIDGQEAAIGAIKTAFDAARREDAGSNKGSNSGASASAARLVLSGPPVFSVDARNTIEREASRLSLIGATLVALLLGSIYRSARALVLGLLPMISGALCGLAVVAAGFGVIHGITLGFGVTLIGEAVDYAIYLFVQRSRRGERSDAITSASAPAMGARASGFWNTIALGVATSVIGFAALIFSGFQGLAQIGILSIVGLVVAASVTRWVLPSLIPAGFSVRAMPRVGRALATATARASRLRWPLLVLAVAAFVVLVVHRDRIWSDDLASLSPVAQADQATDRRLRSELGAPDVRDLVVVVARSEESALRGSERVVAALAPLVADGSLAGTDAPSRYLPSEATQRARQAALPDDATLRANFAKALEGLPFSKAKFDGFFDDAAREKNGPLVTRADLEGSSLAIGTRALLSHHEGGTWTALVALRSPLAQGGATNDVPRARIAAALAPLQRGANADANVGASIDAGIDADVEIRAIDIKTETQQLYVGYLSEAVRAAGFGALAIVALLAVALRDALRLARVLVPLALAVVFVAVAQVALAGPLTLFHLVGLLLIVAVGSNYALFFDRRTKSATPVDADHDDGADDRALLTSLVVANLTAVIGFGVLGFSSLPVLHAIGTTVAPGALLALSLSAVFATTRARSAPSMRRAIR